SKRPFRSVARNARASQFTEHTQLVQMHCSAACHKCGQGSQWPVQCFCEPSQATFNAICSGKCRVCDSVPSALRISMLQWQLNYIKINSAAKCAHFAHVSTLLCVPRIGRIFYYRRSIDTFVSLCLFRNNPM